MNGDFLSPVPSMPSIEIPRKMASEIEGKHVGNKIKAIANYEVVEKDETGTTLMIDSISFNKTKRIL